MAPLSSPGSSCRFNGLRPKFIGKDCAVPSPKKPGRKSERWDSGLANSVLDRSWIEIDGYYILDGAIYIYTHIYIYIYICIYIYGIVWCYLLYIYKCISVHMLNFKLHSFLSAKCSQLVAIIPKGRPTEINFSQAQRPRSCSTALQEPQKMPPQGPCCTVQLGPIGSGPERDQPLSSHNGSVPHQNPPPSADRPRAPLNAPWRCKWPPLLLGEVLPSSPSPDRDSHMVIEWWFYLFSRRFNGMSWDLMVIEGSLEVKLSTIWTDESSAGQRQREEKD